MADAAPPHHDRNYGVIFSIWDRLFGTHYAGADEYPATGIPDRDFPLERSAGVLPLLVTLLRQLLYPFAAILRSLRPAARATAAALAAQSGAVTRLR